MRILILGGSLQGLACGSSLYKKYEVSAVTPKLSCRKSLFFKHVYSDVNTSDESLYNLLEQYNFDVLIPISDMNVPFVSKNKVLIEEKYGVKCGVPDYEQVYQVEDKSRFMAFCEANEVPHPKTRRLTKDTLDQAASEVGFPALIKPDYSVGARGITRVDTIEELEKKHPAISEKYGSCTLQELIENQDYYYNVMLYRNQEGHFLGYTILKIVRKYPVAAGSSSCGVTVENEELLNICKDCLDKLNWVGMADFDVLQRLDNGEYKIIEINPRVPASLRAATISGVNFPEIIALDAMGEKVTEQHYVPGKTLRYLGVDMMWFMKSPKRFTVKPSWFKFIGKNLYYQDIYKEDSSTWWTWLAEGLSKITNRNKKLR